MYPYCIAPSVGKCVTERQTRLLSSVVLMCGYTFVVACLETADVHPEFN